MYKTGGLERAYWNEGFELKSTPLCSLHCKERCDFQSSRWPLLVGLELASEASVEVCPIFPRQVRLCCTGSSYQYVCLASRFLNINS